MSDKTIAEMIEELQARGWKVRSGTSYSEAWYEVSKTIDNGKPQWDKDHATVDILFSASMIYNNEEVIRQAHRFIVGDKKGADD